MNSMAPNYPFNGIIASLSLPLSLSLPPSRSLPLDETSRSPFSQTHLSLLSLKSNSYHITFMTHLSHVNCTLSFIHSHHRYYFA